MKRPARFLTGVILAHGGAGMRVVTAHQRACLAAALVEGHEWLRRGGSAADAVEQTIRVLEASGLFNAGAGARLQLDGARRMDASIMQGDTLRAGAVAAIEGIRHPISAARLIMEETAHVLLVGEQATRFARSFRMDRLPPPRRAQRITARTSVRARRAESRTLRLYQELVRRSPTGTGTVGAVALDPTGTVAAGASTGGIAVMLPGRVGDSPLIGCGVYADNAAGAVSMTGLGESIIRIAVAKEIADRLAGGESPSTAARRVLNRLMRRVGGVAGALVLTRDGRFAIRHTTARMCAGYWGGVGKPVVADRFK